MVNDAISNTDPSTIVIIGNVGVDSINWCPYKHCDCVRYNNNEPTWLNSATSSQAWNNFFNLELCHQIIPALCSGGCNWMKTISYSVTKIIGNPFITTGEHRKWNHKNIIHGEQNSASSSSLVICNFFVADWKWDFHRFPLCYIVAPLNIQFCPIFTSIASSKDENLNQIFVHKLKAHPHFANFNESLCN